MLNPCTCTEFSYQTNKVSEIYRKTNTYTIHFGKVKILTVSRNDKQRKKKGKNVKISPVES